jgi:hypothetical protein
MELLELLYIALGTVGILVLLHLGTFWISRVMQPPKPKIVYVQAPQQQAPIQQQAPPPPTLSQAPPSIQLPTYDSPPVAAAPSQPPAQGSTPLGQLPPPIETRNATKQSSGDLGAPR